MIEIYWLFYIYCISVIHVICLMCSFCVYIVICFNIEHLQISTFSNKAIDNQLWLQRVVSNSSLVVYVKVNVFSTYPKPNLRKQISFMCVYLYFAATATGSVHSELRKMRVIKVGLKILIIRFNGVIST